MAKKSGIPFDKVGGTLVTQRRMLESAAWLGLSAQAKVLMQLIQRHWTPKGPIGFGVRQAEEEIPCSRKTARKAFDELVDGGFIVMVDESLFCSRSQSKSRTWRLTWMPCWNNRPPTNDWEKRKVSIFTGAKTPPET